MKIPRAVFGIINVAGETPHGEYGIAGVRLVRLNPSTCAAIATDGRIVMEITWPDEHEPESGFAATMSREQWEQATDDAPEAITVDELRTNGPLECASDTGNLCRSISAMPCARPFPNHESVIPQYRPEEAVEIGVSPVLLGALCLAFAGLDTVFARMRLIVPKDPKRPIRLENLTDGEVRARAAIMPVATIDQ